MTESTEESNATAEAGTRVVLRDVSVRAGEQTLLHDASAQFEPGQVTLIVGRSGVGKSTLLRMIAGLIDDTTDGIEVKGHIELTSAEGCRVEGTRSVGVVFQDFALFDELSPLDNVRFAHDHRSRKRDVSNESLSPIGLLDELGVPAETRTASLSGGERQRLAVARTLAYDPDVLLYDEPTSGLDAATAAEVTTMIAATHDHHPRTSIIVTHDYASLASIADVIYLLAPETGTLVEIDRADWSQLDKLLEAHAPCDAADSMPASSSRAAGWGKVMARWVGDFFTATSRAIEAGVQVPLRLIPLWKSPYWGGRFLLHYLRAVAGPTAWLYLAIAGGIVGFVSTYFTLRFLPYANYTEPLLIEELVGSIGFALYRIFVPILATILIAARCGAAVASDVGGKSYGRQIDALRTLGADPNRYLQTTILYAFLLGTPVLVAIAYAVAAATSLIVFTATHPERGPWFWQLHFYRELTAPGQILYVGTGWLLAKTLLCAVGIAMIAYRRGASAKDSSRAVSQGVTSTILWSTLFVLVVHFLFAFVEFE